MSRRARLALALAVTGLVLGGCAQSREPKPKLCECTDAGAPVDPVLMAFLSRARTAHHLADGFEERHEIERAIDALRRVVDGPVPGGTNPAPEVREVFADTRARLADLSSQLGRFDDAARQIDQGLALVPEIGFFRGHLFEVRGEIEQRRARALRAAGNEAEAHAAEQRAVEASETSMDIQAQVIQRAASPSSSSAPSRAPGAKPE